MAKNQVTWAVTSKGTCTQCTCTYCNTSEHIVSKLFKTVVLRLTDQTILHMHLLNQIKTEEYQTELFLTVK